ncbi:MAG TPA: hypothetical protein VFH77_09125 [Streptomyces sp.]|nr:hypothetical protein [Streptomyces sp.]
MIRRARRRRTAAPAWVLGAVLPLLLAGCGGADEGTNGVSELSAGTIEKKARAAAEAADSVRLSGTVVSKGQAYRLEMRLKRSGGIGEVSTRGGNTFQLLRVKDELYLKANSEFWIQQEQGADADSPSKADRAAAKKLEGMYVKVPKGDSAYDQLSSFTRMRVLLDGLLTMKGERERGETTKVDGVPAVEVRADGGRGGTMYVALNGKPYPLRMERGGGAGTVRLDDWNTKFAMRAPKDEQVVDYGKKISAGDEPEKS